ncbi:Protein N-terminal asparagine amidohydrolase, partial [Linum perenne]
KKKKQQQKEIPSHGNWICCSSSRSLFFTVKEAEFNSAHRRRTENRIMIFVDDNEIPFPASSSRQEMDALLLELTRHPTVVAASNAFKSLPERKFSTEADPGLLNCRSVYLFQREYATVDPALVDFIGTDEATTCVGLIIRNPKNRMISVSHMDSPTVVSTGIEQMLSQLAADGSDADFDVHIVGGFEDVNGSSTSMAKRPSKLDGYSLPLCSKIIKSLGNRQEKFHIRTLFVLGHNTKRDAQRITYPIFNGVLVETSSGSVHPACFDRTTRCPDEIVRRIRVSASYEDPTWDGKLLDTYDTRTDQFVIASCSWTFYQLDVAFTLQELSDAEILLQCSTSPSAEGPDFVNNLKRQWEYLFRNPKWEDTFPRRKARVFVRNNKGNWDMKDPF